MKKVYEVYLEALKLCEPYHILSSDLRVLLAFDMGFASPIDTLYYKDKEMSEEQIALFNSQVERLKNNEPVEYIINEANFLEYDHDINLGDFNNAKYFLFRDTTNNKLYLCVYTEAGEYFEDDLIAKSKEMDFSTKFKIDFYNKYNKDNI